jgi:hypothetical protein
MIASEKRAGGCNCSNKNPKSRRCIFEVHQVVESVLGRSEFLIKI